MLSVIKNSVIFLVVFLLVGCTVIPGENTTGYLTKKQVLKQEPEADYFELNDKVYVTDIDWIEEVELTNHEIIGEIKNGMASDLPVGTKIIAPKERRDILIAKGNGIEKRYLIMLGE